MDGKTLIYKPAVSVIMAVNNDQNHVAEAIQSVLNQTFEDFEFIIIDDGSSDDTEKIINGFSDPRIIVIKNEIVLGLTKSLNNGLKMARAEYIARMDSDDLSLPDRLFEQKKFLDTHPEICCVGTASRIINEQGQEIGTKIPPAEEAELKFFMIIKNQVAHPSVMFRRSTILANGGYDEHYAYAQDYELWSRLIFNGHKIANIKTPLIKYRSRQKSITQGDKKNLAYSFAMQTVKKNISRYLSVDDAHMEILLKFLHQNRLDTLKDLLITIKLTNRLKKTFLKMERVLSTERLMIEKYGTYLLGRAFRSYIKHQFSSSNL